MSGVTNPELRLVEPAPRRRRATVVAHGLPCPSKADQALPILERLAQAIARKHSGEPDAERVPVPAEQ